MAADRPASPGKDGTRVNGAIESTKDASGVLSGRVAVVTGGSRGIGRALAAALRRAGRSIRLPKVSPLSTMAAAGTALAAKQAAAEAAIHAKRVLLEEAFAASMEAAEELTRTTRRSALGLFRNGPGSSSPQP